MIDLYFGHREKKHIEVEFLFDALGPGTEVKVTVSVSNVPN